MKKEEYKFIDDNIPVAELRAVGFFKKGTKKTDYEYISNRICEYFGLKSIFDYALLHFQIN